MVKKALIMLGVLAIVGVAGLSLLLPDAVNASGHSAARSFVTDSVAAGSELEVTLQVAGLGGFGQVRETLPDGFTFVRSEDVTASLDGQTVAFTILGSDATFNYTVTASTTPGTYEFSGTVGDSNRDSLSVGGVSSVEVTGPKGPEASRSISRSSVDSGGQVTITITTDSDYGAAGTVVETLPEGFSYASSTLSSAAVADRGESVGFTLLGDDSFSYTVNASSEAGDYTFSGIISNFDRLTGDITGDDTVTVNPPAPPAAARSFPAPFVEPSSEVVVTIAASGYGPSGLIEESIPEGFAYLSTDLPGGAVETSGQDIFFIVLGEESITYTVTAPAEAGRYTFSGTLKDINKTEVDIGGDSDLLVGNPGIIITDNGVREINENTPFGVRIGDPIAASSAVSALTFEITSAAADTFDIEADTGQLRTKGKLDFETRASYSLKVTITDEFGESESLVVTIKVLDRDEYVEPTATPEPTETPVPPTATSVPPTATSVPATATSVPPTATSVPATATATPVVEVDEGGGFPVWAIIVIVLAVIAGVAIIGFVVYRRRQG